MKDQLEKGLVTCIQGEKNLNDLLSNQKRHVGKDVLGFGFSTKKTNVNKKPTPHTNDIVFVKERELANDEVEFDTIARSIVPRNIAPHNDFAGNIIHLMCF